MKVKWERTGYAGKSVTDDFLSSARAGRKASVVSEQQAQEAGWRAQSDAAITPINKNQ